MSRRTIFIAAVLIVLLAATGYLLLRLRVEAIHRGFDKATAHARAFEDHLTQSLNIIDLTLSTVSDEGRVSASLAAALRRAPYLRSVALLDAQDTIAASTEAANVGARVVRADFFPDTPEFRAILRVGLPWVGRDFHDGRAVRPQQPADPNALGFVPVLRDVASGKGRWSTLLAALNSDYFLNYYSWGVAHDQGVVELLRYDGTLLLSTDDMQRPGELRSHDAVVSRIAQEQAGHFEQTLSDGRVVLTAYRVARAFPFILVVHLDKQRILAVWRLEAANTLSIVAVLLLFGLALTRLYLKRLAQADLQRRLAQDELRVAAAAFESQEGMIVTDAHGVILRVNPAFTEITGYSAQDVLGQTPRVLQSGHHNHVFYRAMWETIGRTGRWHGEVWNRRKSGEVYPEWLTITTVKNHGGEVSHYVATLTDITLRKAAEEEINSLAFYDPLTQLPNRRLLLDRLQHALAASARSTNHGALFFLDLDNFKALNDTLGHDKGDLLLQQVAQRLVTCVREDDTVVRLGGDEFVVLLEGLSEQAEAAATQAETVGEKVLFELTQPYQLSGHQSYSTPSIGVTLFCGHQSSIEELMKQADLAMYQSKEAGRNTLRFFDPEMQARVSQRVSQEAALREAVRQQEFILYYQVQVGGDFRPMGAEVLLRWRHPQHGLVLPAEFISVAEDSDLILSLGQWVLETACTQLVQWADQPDTAHLTLAVNVSARQLHQANFVEQVQETLIKTGANPQRLKLELTESLLVSNVGQSIAKMSALKAIGVSFSLDDFGTGYSSLSYLKQLPLDQLKIDQSFVRDILTDTDDAAIAKMIIALAETLGLAVIAEGVETMAQKNMLSQYGCHVYQGYLFGEPLPLEDFEALVKQI